MKKFILLSLFSLLLIGCGSTRYVDRTDTIIKTDTITVTPPELRDSLQALEDSLGIIRASKIQGADTILDIRYYPKDKIIYVKVKPPAVAVPHTDTVTISHTTTITKEASWLQTNGIWIIVIIVGLIIIIIGIKIIFHL